MKIMNLLVKIKSVKSLVSKETASPHWLEVKHQDLVSNNLTRVKLQWEEECKGEV